MKKMQLLTITLLALNSILPVYAMEVDRENISDKYPEHRVTIDAIKSIIMLGTLEEFKEQKANLEKLSYETIQSLIEIALAKEGALYNLQSIGFGTHAWHSVIPIMQEVEAQATEKYKYAQTEIQKSAMETPDKENIRPGTRPGVGFYARKYITQELQRLSQQEKTPDTKSRAKILHMLSSMQFFGTGYEMLKRTLEHVETKAYIKENKRRGNQSMIDGQYESYGAEYIKEEWKKISAIKNDLGEEISTFKIEMVYDECEGKRRMLGYKAEKKNRCKTSN
jgi:hypothetical protein